MPSIDDPIPEKKAFKKKSYRSYLSLGETLADVSPEQDLAAIRSRANLPAADLNTAAQAPNVISSEVRETVSQKKKEDGSPTRKFGLSLDVTPPSPDAHNSNLTAAIENEAPVFTGARKWPMEAARETEHKLDTNQTQISAISNTNQTQTEHQSLHKPDTNGTQTEHRSAERHRSFSETRHKVDTKPDTALDTKRTQTEHKPDTVVPFSALVGLQQQFVSFLYSECRKAFDRTTQPLTVDYISMALGCCKQSVKTTLQRLQQKGCIRRTEFKNGRGGWSKYELPDYILLEMQRFETEHKLDTNRRQIEHKVNTQPNTQPDTASSSSSSDLYLNDSTTKTSDQIVADNKWAAVRIERLAHINFTKTHLKQIRDRGLCSPEELDQSIEHFAFDLEKNGKSKEIKTNELGFFMGIMNSKNFYAAPQNFVSEIDLAIRARTEAARRRAQALAEAEFAELSVQIGEWIQGLSAQQKLELLGNDGFLNELSPSIQRVKLQHVYLEKHGLVQEFDRLQRLTSSNV